MIIFLSIAAAVSIIVAVIAIVIAGSALNKAGINDKRFREYILYKCKGELVSFYDREPWITITGPPKCMKEGKDSFVLSEETVVIPSGTPKAEAEKEARCEKALEEIAIQLERIASNKDLEDLYDGLEY